MTHSVPEPVALAIQTGAGTVLHTGDWKFDPDPLVGQAADLEALKRLGDEGVLAMMCDSTNAMVEGSTGSEADARLHHQYCFRGRLHEWVRTCGLHRLKGRRSVAHASHVPRTDAVRN